jgi:ribosome maturation factor RimP
MALIEDIEKLIKPPIKGLSLSLNEVSLAYEQGVHYLRVLIERDDGQAVSLDDIVAATQRISPLLDEANLIHHTYTLDVASSGAEHEILVDALKQYVNRFVKIELAQPLEGQHVYQGKILACTDQTITIEFKVKTRVKQVVLEKLSIKKANLAIH